MSFFLDGLTQAWQLIISGDPALVFITLTTLQVAAIATSIALVIGLPLGLWLGLGRFRGRRFGIALANAGLGLPPVVVGLVLSLLFFPAAPLGGLQLGFTLQGVFVAQTILALPVVVALTVSAVQAISPGLLDQARAFGASRVRVAGLAVREARVGIMTATIAAVGTTLAEVGAVVLVGGNINGTDQTLASAALERVNGGRYAEAVAVGIVLIALILLIAAILTVLQYWDGRLSGRRRRA